MQQRILVIDGHPVYAQKLEGFIRGLTYKHIVVARSGEEGVQIAQSQDFDLVVLSGALYDMDSFTVCKKLKEINDRLKIIVQVGLLTDEEGMIKFKESGADAVLYRKEKNMDSLQDSIEELLRGLELDSI